MSSNAALSAVLVDQVDQEGEFGDSTEVADHAERGDF